MADTGVPIPTNCLDCEHHRVERDPDPRDSFCSDDEAVLCSLTPNAKGSCHYAVALGPFANRPVTVICRPYQKRAESARPSWCPLTRENA